MSFISRVQSALADVNKAKSIHDFNSKITNAAQEPLAFKESEENNDFDLGDFNDFGGNDDFNDDINTHDNSSHTILIITLIIQS